MAKRDDYMKGRQEGMSYALKIAREGGLEALEKEIKYRNIENYWYMGLNKKETQEVKEKIALRTKGIITCVSLLVLRDEFGFGKERGLRFLKRFDTKVDCLIGDPDDGQTVTLEDYAEAVRQEMGIKVEISEGIGRKK